MKRLLLMSSSRKGDLGYLAHAREQIDLVLKGRAKRVLFVPYAGGITSTYDEYEQMTRPVFEQGGFEFESIHRANPLRAIAEAEAIAIGGGNTFALLKRLYDERIVDAIRERVNDGMPYIGWSAGCNVACPTIRTTNDMPIVQPPTLRALGLIHFQINPHFISGKPAGFNGESREERIAEFLAINPREHVVALPEGTALLVDGAAAMILGEQAALHFVDSHRAIHLTANEIFNLGEIKGPVIDGSWPISRQ
ncbi:MULTISPECIES: dipeptidase PepE [unclassified Burkholderia]|uniref:dipeptidase PepE n=1 Tax=unclassified Burkholderia TaxID=2613784 RepID=UPI0007C7D506